jgi:hypothetical protein
MLRIELDVHTCFGGLGNGVARCDIRASWRSPAGEVSI